MTAGSDIPRIHAIVAAAGAGKTYRLCSDIAEAVQTVPPEKILGATFTVKAAAELIERARERLFAEGNPEAASRLLGARFGTVNGVCGKLAAEFALELGRSPAVDVIPEAAAGHLFSLASAAAIERHAAALNDLAETLGMTEPRFGGGDDDWRAVARDLVGAARANGLGAEGLRRSGALSAEGFAALLPEPGDADALDAALRAAVEAAVAAIPPAPSKGALPTIGLLRRAATQQGFDALHWSDWAKLTAAKAAKKDTPAFNDALDRVRAAAAEHPRHPRMHRQALRFIDLIFDCAADALADYDAFKARRGLVDFVDQEALALEALERPEIAARLSESIERVFVDEFQDSSPLQIAICTHLARIARQSAWVGDPKQAIYAFRNADSALTQAVFDGVTATSAAPLDRLATSRRSRLGIIEAVNAAFAPALDAMGLPSAQHSFDGSARQIEEAKYSRAAITVWRLGGKNQGERLEALVGGIAAALGAPEAWPVKARGDAAPRPLRPSDIGVLCRSNDQAQKVSAALAALGIPVAADRDRLTDTPHVQAALAACRWCADARDTLALAELARLFDDDPASGRWLEAAGAEDAREALAALSPLTAQLDALRSQLGDMLPSEALDAVLSAPALLARAARFEDPALVREDWEALRASARAWEAERSGAGASVGLAGLCAAVAESAPPRPARIDGKAVDVLTYHRAKGLEWPVCVLTQLDKTGNPRIFGEPVAASETALDWTAPLAGRWVRFWPWPYGGTSKDIPLADAAAQSATGQDAARRAVEEDVRLLYVGMTRARDHLVLASENEAPSWLETLGAGISLPTAPGAPLQIGGQAFPTVFEAPSAAEAAAMPEAAVRSAAPKRESVEHPALRLAPSSQTGAGGFRVTEQVELGPRIPLLGAPDVTAVGEALHAAFGMERGGLSREACAARVARLFERWDVRALAPGSALDAAERLEAWAQGLLPAGRILREAPVQARRGDRLASGRIDMLVIGAEGFVVIDHKSYPGGEAAASERAAGHGAQLQIYAEGAAAALGLPCLGMWVHLPVSGRALRVENAT